MNAPTPAQTMTATARTAAAEACDREYRARKLRPLHALRAFGRLMRDKEDTRQVFEIMNALTGLSTPKGYARLTWAAGGVAFAREELSRSFSDPVWLAKFEPGTVGAAYREFMSRENLTTEGLRKDNEAVSPFVEAPHVFAWYARRLRDIHDVWHILTGYGRDALGEACLVAFSHAQTGNKGFGFIGLMASFRVRSDSYPVPTKRAVWEAWRNGRKAAWLPAQDYAAVFAEPLESARARLGIASPKIYLSVPEEVRETLTFGG
jgi:ubiquinone biosynthesis protein COQ4